MFLWVGSVWAQFRQGHGHFSSVHFNLSSVILILLFYLLASLSLTQRMWWILIILSFAAIFHVGNKMFKLAHRLLVNPLWTCAVDDVHEAWCAQGEHGGANHTHCTAAVTKHVKHRPFNSPHVCFGFLVCMWEFQYWYLVCLDLWPPQVALLCSSAGCCNIFWHRGGGGHGRESA